MVSCRVAILLVLAGLQVMADGVDKVRIYIAYNYPYSVRT